MRTRIPYIVRLITGVTLLALSIGAMSGEGFVRWLAYGEITAAAAFCLPWGWRIAGAGLLAVLLIALAHHALMGQFAPSLLFASLVVTLELARDRP